MAPIWQAVHYVDSAELLPSPVVPPELPPPPQAESAKATTEITPGYDNTRLAGKSFIFVLPNLSDSNNSNNLIGLRRNRDD